MARIAIIHHSGIIGGAGISLLNTVNALADKHELTVFVSDSPRDILDALNRIAVEKGINVVSYGRRIGSLPHYSGGDRVMSARFLYRAALILKQWHYWNNAIHRLDPDIVMVNSITLSWMSRLPALRSRKSICFVRETIYGDRHKRINRHLRKNLQRFSRVSYISDYDRNSWQLSPEKTGIIYNCLNQKPGENSVPASRDETSRRLGLRPESFHILFVGGVSHMKGADLAVDSALKTSRDVELMIAGVDFNDRRTMSSGRLSPYETELETLILSEAGNSIIHLLGRQKDMTQCYRAADVLVIPMRSPHQARPVFEAGFSGLPVIITDFPNIREFVRDSYNGLVFRSNDSDQLTSCLENLIDHPEIRRQMGRNNLTLSLANHTMERFHSAINSLIDSLQ